MNEKNVITVNSAILYVLAFLLTTIIHEFLHAIIGLFFMSNPIIYHNYVEHLLIEHLTSNQKILIALAGPIISLIQGISSGAVYYKLRKKSHKLIHLFLLWFSVLGFFNFLGYAMTGFLFKNGDIGKVYTLSSTPFWIQIILAILAALILVFVAYKMTVPYLRFSYKKEWVENGKSRKNFSFRTLFLPWVIGSFVVTILYLPIIALISIIYPIMSGMIFIFPWQNAEGVREISTSTNKEIGKLSILGIGVLIILIFVFKFILASGIEL
jgi:hypothetical protein